jgi:hypothetical protein
MPNMNNNTHSELQSRLCKCRNKKIKNQYCVNEINCNTVPFLLNLKYDIMRQETMVTNIQNSINHNNEETSNITSILDSHLLNNITTMSQINGYLKCICKHIVCEDYIESGVDENMIKIRYCQICELTFDE